MILKQNIFFGVLLLWMGLFTSCLPDSGNNKPTDPLPEESRNSKWDSIIHEINQSNNPNREAWQKPDLVLDQLGNLSEKVVADIGAGSGYFTLLLPKRGAKVIAIDIDDQALEGIRESMFLPFFPAEFRDQIELRKVTEDDPKLDDEEVDAVIIINTIAYIQNRVDYLQKVKAGLRPGGSILIVDYKSRRIPLNIPPQNRIPLFQIEDELYQAGFSFITADDCSLDYQYMIKATKT